MSKKYYRKFKGVEECFLIKVVEGEGTGECSMEQIGYLISKENGRLIGVVSFRGLDGDLNSYDPQNPTGQGQ